MSSDEPLRVLRDFADRAQGAVSRAGLLTELAQAVPEALQGTEAAVVSRPPGGRYVVVSATSEAVEGLERVQEALQQGPCCDALTTQRSATGADAESDFRRWPDFTQHAYAVGLPTVASVPLLARGEVWAVLNLYRCGRAGLSGPDMALAEALTAVTAGYLVLLQNHELVRLAHRKDAQAATRDALTGLANRVLLSDRFSHAHAVAARRGERLGLVFVDLNDFKAVNDTYGHLVGDAVLVECASRLASVSRVGDTLARIGGDEFVLLCENLQGDGSCSVEASLGAIAARAEAALSSPMTVGVDRIAVGASIGVASADPRVSDLEALLRDADHAMYRTKQAGRPWDRPAVRAPVSPSLRPPPG